MPTFQYRARDGQGQQREGVLEAETNSVAVAQLREQGLWVTGLQAVGAPGAAPDAGRPPARLLDPVWSGVSLKDLALFFRQFATLINAGMPLFQSLATLQAQTSNARLRQVIARLAAQTERGGRLSEAFREFPAIFTPLQISMIEAAEAGGMLDVILIRLAEYLEREYEIRLQIKRKTLYPKLLVLAVIFIPQLPTLVLQGLEPFLRSTVGVLIPFLIGYGALYVLFRYLFQFEAFRAFYDEIKLSLPVVGGLVRKLTVGKLTRALGALYAAGLPVPAALSRAAAASGNARFARSLERVRPMLERGDSLSAAMASTGLFTPMVLGMVRTGEQTGDMESMLNKVAEYQEGEATHALNQLITILGVAALLLACLLAASKILGFWTSYATAIQQAGSE